MCLIHHLTLTGLAAGAGGEGAGALVTKVETFPHLPFAHACPLPAHVPFTLPCSGGHAMWWPGDGGERRRRRRGHDMVSFSAHPSSCQDFPVTTPGQGGDNSTIPTPTAFYSPKKALPLPPTFFPSTKTNMVLVLSSLTPRHTVGGQEWAWHLFFYHSLSV